MEKSVKHRRITTVMSEQITKIASSYAFIVTEHLIQKMHCTSMKGLTTTCPMGVVIVTEGFSFPIKSKPI